MLTRLTLTAALLLAASPALAAQVVRGPFLQQTTGTGTLVVVHTDAPAAVELLVTSSLGPVAAVQSGSAQEHVLAVEGLAPATRYGYRVTIDGVPEAGSHSFRTPGARFTADGRQLVLGVIGDMGTGGPNEHANVELMRQEGVQAVLTVGDNAYSYGAPEEWDPMFFRPFAPLIAEVPVFPALGDHEYHTPGASGFLDAFELPQGPSRERYYSFDWGDIHVAALDTQCLDPFDGVPVGDGCDEATMMAWLDADLAAADAPWKLIIMHRPALATGAYGTSRPVADAVTPIAEAHGVDLVLQGHNHFYERSWPVRGGAAVQRSYVESGAPVYVTTGGGGDWIYESRMPAEDWTAFRETTYQHLVLRLARDTLTVESIRPDGSLVDRFAIEKEVAVPPPAGRVPCRVLPDGTVTGSCAPAPRIRPLPRPPGNRPPPPPPPG